MEFTEACAAIPGDSGIPRDVPSPGVMLLGKGRVSLWWEGGAGLWKGAGGHFGEHGATSRCPAGTLRNKEQLQGPVAGIGHFAFSIHCKP